MVVLNSFRKIENTMSKLSKQQAGYAVISDSDADLKGVSCNQCSFFDQHGKCMVVSGGIRAVDSCNLWTKDSILNLTWVSGQQALEMLQNTQRLTKSQAGYVCSLKPSMRPQDGKGFGCAMCKYYSEEKQGCFPVQGTISRGSCCNLFTFPEHDTDFSYVGGSQVEKKVNKMKNVIIQDIEDLTC